jgi:hypothetical protein
VPAFELCSSLASVSAVGRSPREAALEAGELRSRRGVEKLIDGRNRVVECSADFARVATGEIRKSRQ